jgi:hypothetical protein
VLVLLGKTFDFSPKLQVGALTEVVNVTAESSRQIDLSSVTIAHNVTSEEFDRIPKTRSFQGIALTSPGVNQGQIEGGFQVNGASGAENAFTVDGVSTTSVLYGSSQQDTAFEYVQEVQVKTGGIDAEYGGALGGVISAVTKSGGNSFRGEGHYYYFGNGISASPVQRLQLSPIDDTTVFKVQDEKQKNNTNEVGGSIGGPIVHDHLFFFGAYSPQFISRENNYTFSGPTRGRPQARPRRGLQGDVFAGDARTEHPDDFDRLPVRCRPTVRDALHHSSQPATRRRARGFDRTRPTSRKLRHR